MLGRDFVAVSNNSDLTLIPYRAQPSMRENLFLKGTSREADNYKQCDRKAKPASLAPDKPDHIL